MGVQENWITHWDSTYTWPNVPLYISFQRRVVVALVN
jgi:hypothetical protein